MATNPMQRKAKVSFLLGMVITLLITGAVIALLLFQLKNYRDKEAAEQANKAKVYVLNADVKSGQVITRDMFVQKEVNKTLIPSNAVGNLDILDSYALADKDGNEITTNYDKNEPKLYIKRNGRDYELKETESGNYNYFIEINGEREEINLIEAAIVAKVDMNKNTVLTLEMISKSNEQTTNDLRKQEYNMLVLPTQLQTGDYIDIRLAMPTGEDYIVIAKKQVEIPQIGGIDSESTIWIKMSEEETITMNNAMVDAWRILGSKLYVTIYTEAGIQETATPTYVPTGAVMELIRTNPNVIQQARNELTERFNNYGERVRNESINPSINNNADEGEENVKTKVEESGASSKEERKQYLQSLGGDY